VANLNWVILTIMTVPEPSGATRERALTPVK
jgi:hypothetical protein